MSAEELQKAIEETFPTGCVVRVRNQKVPMTVESHQPRVVLCVWFDKKQTLQRGGFDPVILEKVG